MPCLDEDSQCPDDKEGEGVDKKVFVVLNKVRHRDRTRYTDSGIDEGSKQIKNLSDKLRADMLKVAQRASFSSLEKRVPTAPAAADADGEEPSPEAKGGQESPAKKKTRKTKNVSEAIATEQQRGQT